MTEEEWIKCKHASDMLIIVNQPQSSERRVMLLCIGAFNDPSEFYDSSREYGIWLAAFEEGTITLSELDDYFISLGQVTGTSFFTPENARYWLATTKPAQHRACRLILDIFGNPFRPIAADPAWLTPTVQSIATAIYEDRAFDSLPILADALEEAGCTNVDMLLHCRKPGEHVRGCWVVDLVLGKE